MLEEFIIRALVWQSLEAQNPPELDSTEYGWVKDDQNKSIQPVTLPDEVELVLKYELYNMLLVVCVRIQI